MPDIRVVVGIDFGTTYSGYACAHKINPKIEVNQDWPGIEGPLKTNTVLQYDENFNEVEAWGFPALAKAPRKKRRDLGKLQPRPVEYFKLHLGNLESSEKPPLPRNLSFKKAITDYLYEIGKLITTTVTTRWPDIDMSQNVLFVLAVPAEFSEEAKSIMKECAHQARIFVDPQNLEFTTEPEAAAIHCMRVLKEHGLKTGASFLTVDCGGGTVDLTMRKLLPGNRLGEITERTGDFCGGTYVDKEFLKFLGGKVGHLAIKLVESNHYGRLQHMVHHFCRCVKIPFPRKKSEFKTFELDIEDVCPEMKQYVTGEAYKRLEEEDWVVDLDFKSVKAMFDPVIEKIIRLIRDQLDARPSCSTMFLVGGFSNSKYLQARIKAEFRSRVSNISVPPQPIAAIMCGAVDYGLNMDTIKTRTLKWTYGIDVSRVWKNGDPPERKDSYGYIEYFSRLVERGREVDVNEEFGGKTYTPIHKYAKSISFNVYTTPEHDGTYCDDYGMKLLGKLRIDLSDLPFGCKRNVDFTLKFGKMEIEASARNQLTDQIYKTSFDLEF